MLMGSFIPLFGLLGISANYIHPQIFLYEKVIIHLLFFHSHFHSPPPPLSPRLSPTIWIGYPMFFLYTRDMACEHLFALLFSTKKSHQIKSSIIYIRRIPLVSELFLFFFLFAVYECDTVWQSVEFSSFY